MKNRPQWLREVMKRVREDAELPYVPGHDLANVEGSTDEGFALLDDFTPFDEWAPPCS